MGCFDSTCGVSQTAVHAGDKIFLIRLSNDLLKKVSRGPLDDVYSTISRKVYEASEGGFSLRLEYMAQLEKEGKVYSSEEYDKWLEQNKESLISKTKEGFVSLFGHGEYDDYGWIEGMEQNDDEWSEDMYNVLYVHEWAMEALLRKKINEILIMPPGEVVYEMMEAARWMRLNIFHHSMLGQQHRDDDEMERQMILAQATTKFLRKKIKEYREEY